MTNIDIIRMAREVKATAYTNRHYPDNTAFTFSTEKLKAFEALVRADERSVEPVANAKAIAECLAVLRPAVKGRFPHEQALEELAGYTTPPAAQRQSARSAWVGLTDEELRQVWYDDAPVQGGTYIDKLRQVETKLKEKNT